VEEAERGMLVQRVVQAHLVQGQLNSREEMAEMAVPVLSEVAAVAAVVVLQQHYFPEVMEGIFRVIMGEPVDPARVQGEPVEIIVLFLRMAVRVWLLEPEVAEMGNPDQFPVRAQPAR